MTNPTCKTCRYFQEHLDHEFKGEGNCRRRAPTTDHHFPQMMDTYWCGEHKSVEDVEEYKAFADRLGPATKEGVAWARKQAERLGLDHKGQPNHWVVRYGRDY